MMLLVPEMVKELDDYTKRPQTLLNEGQINVENEDYSCIPQFATVTDDDEYEGDIIASGIEGKIGIYRKAGIQREGIPEREP